MTRISVNALALAIFATAPALAADQVTNGTFDENTDGWFSSENITMERVDGMVCADVPGGTVNPWDVIIGQNGVAQELGESYEFRFDAMGTAPAPIRALVGEAQAPWTVFYSTVPVATPEVSTISNTFPASANDPAAQVAFQVGGQQGHDTIPTEGLGEGRIREDQRRFVFTWRLAQNGFQRHRGPGDRRPLPRIEPCGDLTRFEGRQGAVESLDRNRSLHRVPPGEAGFPCRSGQIAGAQQVHRVAQLPCPFRPTGESDTSLRRAQREAIPQQDFGHLRAS